MVLRRHVRSAGVLAGLLSLAAALLLAGLPARTQATPPIPPPPPESLTQAPREGPGPRARPPANPKIERALAEAAAAAAPRAGAARARIQAHVSIDPAALAEVRAAIVAAGGEVRIVGSGGTLIQASLPPAALADLAALPAVHMLRHPSTPVRQEIGLTSGDVTSEGVELLGVEAWHAAGFTGEGVCIGIIENGFAGYAALLGSELPPADMVDYRDFADPEYGWPDTEFGTAQAEVIHDLAPDACLRLARSSNDLEFEQAVDWLQAEGVTIIASAVGWPNRDPGDGTGFIADIVARSRAAGITWLVAAHDNRLQHWGGIGIDRDGDSYLGIDGLTQINYFRDPIPAGVEIEARLRWSDWTNVDQDLDLVLVRWDGATWETYAVSDNAQDGRDGQRPAESLDVFASGETTYYGVAVRSITADRPLNVDVFVYPYHFQEPTPSRSLLNLGDAPDAITIAAVDSRRPFEVEPYSGEGPTNGPGGTLGGGREKPDLSSFTNVSTETYGRRAFSWTAAANAHAAGAAALVRSAYPDFSPDEVEQFLRARAVDLGRRGWEPRTGHGLLTLGAPPSSGGDGYRPDFDFDGDQKSDILWRSDRLGLTRAFLMDGTLMTARPYLPPAGNVGAQPVTVGDFNGDGAADVFWIDPFTNRMQLRITGQTGAAGRWVLNPGWVVAGSGDFNGDGTDDLFFRSPERGLNYLWLMRDGAVLQPYPLELRPRRWQVVGVADLNGDGRDDILWRSAVTGRHRLWLMDGPQVIRRDVLRWSPWGTDWVVQALADFDGDGTADILWRRGGTSPQRGWVRVDYLRDGQRDRLEYLYQARNAGYRIVAVADYNGDGRADLTWRDMRSGGIYVYLHAGATILAADGVGGAGLGWRVVGPSSYDGERLATAGGTALLADAERTGPRQGDDPAPGDPGAPIGDPPADPDPGPPPGEPDVEDPGTPEDDSSEPIDTVVIPDAATLEEIAAIIYREMLAAEPTTIYLPMLAR